MNKMMKLPFLSRASSDSKPSSWPWPSCTIQPRTLSFRTPEECFKTMNSAYLDPSIEIPDSWLANSFDPPSFSTQSDRDSGRDPVETVIRGLRSDRLFFEPGKTSSILEEAKPTASRAEPAESAFKESTLVVPMDSRDPYVDFRKSMDEMVEAHGLKDWKGLEELLFWYLRVNDKSNHEYIVAAFLDLLVGLSFSSTDKSCHPPLNLSSSSCSSSPLSFYTSSSSLSSSSLTPCISSSLEVEEDEEHGDLSCLEVKKEIIEVIKDDDANSSL